MLGAVLVGAAAFAMVGAAIGSALNGVAFPLEGAFLGVLVGSGLGLVLGWALGGRVVSRLPEPLASERSYVGARTPDAGEKSP